MKTAFSKIVFFFMLILSVGSLYYSYSQGVRADQMEELAKRNAVMAQQNADEAVKQRQIAEEQMLLAKQQQQKAEEMYRQCQESK